MRKHGVNKLELITWIATLPEDDPRLELVENIRRGEDTEPDELLLSLKELSQKVRKHVVWLARLRVPEVCGEGLAGRRSYRLSRVLNYLKTDECRARITELNTERRARERARKSKA